MSFIFLGTVLTCQFQPGILRTYIFDEIRNKSGWFCRNNNFTVTKIYCDFNRVLLEVGIGRSFKWPTARKRTIVVGIFDFSTDYFHKLSSSSIFDWPFTLFMIAHFGYYPKPLIVEMDVPFGIIVSISLWSWRLNNSKFSSIHPISQMFNFCYLNCS